ncbi:unnamed protein product [Ixodes pacificus]
MVAIWDEHNKYKIWMEIELYACEAQVKLGIVPQHVLEGLKRKNGSFDIERMQEIELETKHDVIAFLSYISESANVDMRYLHYGMTSSDVLDTCLSLQLKMSCDILLKNLDDVLSALRERAEETRYLPCIGRSHGVHAEPITFGLKLARFYAEFKRHRQRLVLAKQEVSVCKISGAMGNFAHVDPFVEQYVGEALGLVPETVSSQVIPRDRYAMFFATLGVISSSIENIAVEVRSLQQTEISEITEHFSQGQKGSSAMPHKKNPILSENLTGLSRIIRGYVIPALENVALWYERDISHSSVERFIAPDACITMNFALVRLENLIRNMNIHEDKVKANLDNSQGLIFSQRVLLALVNSGMSREDAYKVVQDSAMQSHLHGSSFVDGIRSHPMLLQGVNLDLDFLTDLSYYMRHVDTIFQKVFDN